MADWHEGLDVCHMEAIVYPCLLGSSLPQAVILMRVQRAVTGVSVLQAASSSWQGPVVQDAAVMKKSCSNKAVFSNDWHLRARHCWSHSAWSDSLIFHTAIRGRWFYVPKAEETSHNEAEITAER